MTGPKFGTIKSFYKNEIIFKEGQSGNVGYLVRTGEVVIYKMIGDEKKVLAVLGPGEVFGEMGIITEAPRTACAQAGEYCDLVIIDKETLYRLLKKSPKMIQSITLLLMKRLAHTLELLDDHDEDKILPKHFTCICSLLDLLGNASEDGIGYRHFCKRAADISRLSVQQIETIISRLEQLNILTFDNDYPGPKPPNSHFKVCVDSRHLLKTAKNMQQSAIN
jgi:CRP-like cAMP-binding protein